MAPRNKLKCLNPCCFTHSLFSEQMDESWRMPMGTNNLPPPRSPEDTNRNNGVHGYEALDPEDFDDVFGGPPRSVLSRQYSVEGNFARSTSLVFEDIFRTPNRCMDLGGRSDRTLPEFRIPESKTVGRLSEEEFYSDIFGNSRRSRSRSISQANSNSKSKSNSSSILSSEELSPFRPAVVEDGDVSFSSFAAKLRPINVSSKWNTSKKTHEVPQMADSPCNFDSFQNDYTHKSKGCYSGFSQSVPSPEITTFRPNSCTSIKESTDDLQVNSPASVVSSLNQDQGDETSTTHEDDDDEVMSSFVIEINPWKNKEKIRESDGVDEAIAWAKQKCKAHNLEKEWDKREDDEPECAAVEEPLQELEKDVNKNLNIQYFRKYSINNIFIQVLIQMELELLDEDIKLWSDGKEPTIRSLISTLHHILWPSSGWIMIPITDLKDSSNVKKAYQKARLCLHPEKLQQRGATISQKYVAEKAFPILQDAWAAFISQDASL